MAARPLKWWTQTIARLRSVALEGAPLDDIVAEVMEELGYDAALLVFGVDLSVSQTVVHLGYSDAAAQYLAGAYVRDCPGYLWATQEELPTRFIDLPFDFRETTSFQTVLGPEGFNEGITLPLTTPFSGSKGFLAMSSRRGIPLDDGDRMALGLLGEALAGVASPETSYSPFWRPADYLLRIDSEQIVPVGHHDLPRFIDLERLKFLATRVAKARTSSGFHLLDRDGRWWRVSLIMARDSASVPCVLARFSSRAVGTITQRELDVVGGIRAGLSNQEIADLLRVSLRTVKTHLEKVSANLGVVNRTELASMAWREDLSSLETEVLLAGQLSVS